MFYENQCAEARLDVSYAGAQQLRSSGNSARILQRRP